MPRRKRAALTKIEVVVIIGVILLLVALLLPNIQQSRGSARQVQCRNNLRQVSLALHRYHDTYGSFPPAVTTGPDGEPWHSWRTLLLPYIEEDELWDRYRLDEPWNSEANLAMVEKVPMPTVFQCPADESPRLAKTTSFVAVIGERTMWPPDGVVSLDEIPDGASYTIHVVERTDSGILWTEPRDLQLDDLDFTVQELTVGEPLEPIDAEAAPRSESHHHVAFADGSVQALSLETEPEVVKSMLLRNDGPSEESP